MAKSQLSLTEDEVAELTAFTDTFTPSLLSPVDFIQLASNITLIALSVQALENLQGINSLYAM